MRCPVCFKQSPDDAELCYFCCAVLTPVSKTTSEITTKTSGLAIAALVLGIISLFSCGITAIPAIILGIIGYTKIEKSGGKLVGRDLAVIGIVISVVGLCLLGILRPALKRVRSISPRMVCGSNLSGLGRAMLIYANDYENQFPRAGGTGTIWQENIKNWQAHNRFDAFGLKPDGTGGSATISSSLYLLVKYAEVMPEQFLCYGDSETTKFKPKKYGVRSKKLIELWDFGPEPTKHYSYSYHMPYSPYFLSMATSEPGMAVMADRNPWMDPYTDTTGFKWDDQTMTGGREDIKGYEKGNSGHHKREGQNVLFMDNHVSFEKASFCGVNDDNIYTYWNDSDIQQGAPPVIGSQPTDKLDSLLVNEPPKEDHK